MPTVDFVQDAHRALGKPCCLAIDTRRFVSLRKGAEHVGDVGVVWPDSFFQDEKRTTTQRPGLALLAMCLEANGTVVELDCTLHGIALGLLDRKRRLIRMLSPAAHCRPPLRPRVN